MKKLVVTLSVFCAMITYSQKNELKTLKKLSEKRSLNALDYQFYKDAVVSLKDKAVTEDEKVAAKYYDAMIPVAEIATKAEFPLIEHVINFLKPENFDKYLSVTKETLAYEQKTGTKNYTDEILRNNNNFKNILRSAAFKYNDVRNYRDASDSFYKVYQIDSSDKSFLENAAITALQGQEYVKAEKLFREMKALNYFGGGTNYSAKSKINEKEEIFVDKATRDNAVKLGTHTLPKDQVIPSKKNEYLKILAELAVTNKNIEAAKSDYKEVKALLPNDIELLTNEANLYYNSGDKATYTTLIKNIIAKDPNNAALNYNIGIIAIEEDAKLVEEINANLKNKVKYDQLNTKRKDMFTKALPYFEKAYQNEPSNNDYKTILKSAYEITGMKDKALNVK